MKKVAAIALLLMFSVAAFTQNNPSAVPLTKEDLLQKSKNQRTAGWVLLGGGAGLVLAGSIVMVDAIGNDLFVNSNNYNSKTNTGTVLVVAGLVAMGGSIPLLIVGHKNHKKAMALALTNKNIQMLQKGSWSYQSYPAISFSIHIGRK